MIVLPDGCVAGAEAGADCCTGAVSTTGACTGAGATAGVGAVALKATAGATGLFFSIRILLPFFVSISRTLKSFLFASSINLLTSSRSYFFSLKTSSLVVHKLLED